MAVGEASSEDDTVASKLSDELAWLVAVRVISGVDEVPFGVADEDAAILCEVKAEVADLAGLMVAFGEVVKVGVRVPHTNRAFRTLAVSK